MSRLVIVSNRVAVPGQEHAGGLAVALLAVLRQQGGLWFGWSGSITASPRQTVHEQDHGGVRFVTMDLQERDHDNYYNGFSNRTLWPLLHSRPDLVACDRVTRAGYWRVNQLFADRLAPLLRDSDRVWIHDYHLIPLASLLRQRGIGCRIGFFLHVPMPAGDLVQALPHHHELMSCLHAYDLVGFQTHGDVDRFKAYACTFGSGRILSNEMIEAANGRQFRVGAFPIGIDPAAIARQAAGVAKDDAIRKLDRSLHGRKLAIGADRLDYSKGLPERFHGFERYLQRYPGQKGRVTYLQIAPISRGGVSEYQALRNQLEQIAGNINGNHAEPDWTPIRYVNKTYRHDTLTGFYRVARMALVTPLRDGMNLVAKEYVAAQDAADPGVLVLSALAGAAVEMKEAVIVSPYDMDDIADAIAMASAMSLSERRARWVALMQRLRRNDITRWQSDYLQALEKS